MDAARKRSGVLRRHQASLWPFHSAPSSAGKWRWRSASERGELRQHFAFLIGFIQSAMPAAMGSKRCRARETRIRRDQFLQRRFGLLPFSFGESFAGIVCQRPESWLDCFSTSSARERTPWSGSIGLNFFQSSPGARARRVAAKRQKSFQNRPIGSVCARDGHIDSAPSPRSLENFVSNFKTEPLNQIFDHQ